MTILTLLCAARPGAADCIDPGNPANSSQLYEEVERADEFINLQTSLALSVIMVTSVLQWYIHPFAFKHQNFLEQWFLCSSAICVGLAYVYTNPPTRVPAVEIILATFLAGSIIAAGTFLLILHRQHAKELRRKISMRRAHAGGRRLSSLPGFDDIIANAMDNSEVEIVSATVQSEGEAEPSELQQGEPETGEPQPEEGGVPDAKSRWHRAFAKSKTVHIAASAIEVQVHDSFDRMDTVHVDASAVEVKALPLEEAESSKEDVPEVKHV